MSTSTTTPGAAFRSRTAGTGTHTGTGMGTGSPTIPQASLPPPPPLQPFLAAAAILGGVLGLVDLVRGNPDKGLKVGKALHISMEAKSGQEAGVIRLLEHIRDIVEDEPGTRPWYATRPSRREFEIFETFPNAAARSRHLSGRGARMLLARAPFLLVRPPTIRQLDVILDKPA